MADMLTGLSITAFDGYTVAIVDVGQAFLDMVQWFHDSRRENLRMGVTYPETIMGALEAQVDPKLAEKYEAWKKKKDLAWALHARIVLESNPRLVAFAEGEQKLKEAEALLEQKESKPKRSHHAKRSKTVQSSAVQDQA